MRILVLGCHRLRRLARRTRAARRRPRGRRGLLVAAGPRPLRVGPRASSGRGATSPTSWPSATPSRASTGSATSCTRSTCAGSPTATAPAPTSCATRCGTATYAGSSTSPGLVPDAPGRRALPTHLLAARGRAGARRGRERALLGAVAARRRRDRRRLDVVRGDPPAGDAAAGAAGAELAGEPRPADRRQRRAPRDGRGVRGRPPHRRPRHRRTQRAAVLPAARRVRPRRRAPARPGAHPPGARAAGQPRHRRDVSPRPSGRSTPSSRACATTWSAGRGRPGCRRTAEPLLGVREAMARSLRPSPAAAPRRRCASDPDWTRMRAPVLDELHAPATVRAGASLALRRVQALRSLL